MKTTTKTSSAIQLSPADELTITVDQPMLIEVTQVGTGRPVDVNMAKQWGTERELRQEVILLRGHVKDLTWQLNHYHPPRLTGDEYERAVADWLAEHGRPKTTAGAWAAVEDSLRECRRLIRQAFRG